MTAPAHRTPLILGGHSFLSQLGSDPKLSPAGMTDLVATCLDAGVCCFDTTYQPERIALGRAMAELDRREEAEIIAWNFFTDFDDDGEPGPPAGYQADHIHQMLDQLQTDRIDHLVVHLVGDKAADEQSERLARQWRDRGLVKRLGIWAFGPDTLETIGRENPYDFMVQPYNTGTPHAPACFAEAKSRGWETLACSPFRRGWRLESFVSILAERDGMPEAEAVGLIADRMLRYSLYRPDVDRLIVAMRRPAWVAANVESVARGPLSEAELAWLTDLQAAFEATEQA